MLLSGVDTHLNGLGNMDEWTAPNQRGAVGYEGYLNNRVATLPQLLKDAGYHTYMVGKWHLGKAPDQIPAARGFERDFSLLDGAGSYWDMTNFTAASPQSVFTEDGRYLTKLPKDYYATKTYTDKLIGFIDANRGDGKPFFAYVAHQAPHDPYHLPKDWRNRHVGEYDKGWDAVRQERLKRQVELGIMPAGTQLAERMWFVPDPIVLAPASAGRPRQEDGALRRHGGEPRLPRRPAHRPPEEDRRVREHDLRRVRRQRRRGHRPLQDDRRHARHARLPLRGDQLVADPSQRLGRPGLVRRLRPDVGAGVDDALQPVQGLARPKAASATRSSSAARPSSGPRAASTTGSCMWPTSCRRCSRSPAPAIRRRSRGASCPRSWASPGARCWRARRSRRGRSRTSSPGSSSATARCGRATGSCAGSTSRYGKGDWELFNLAADPAERKDLAAERPDKVKALVALWDDYVRHEQRGPAEPLRVRDPGRPAAAARRRTIRASRRSSTSGSSCRPRTCWPTRSPERCRRSEISSTRTTNHEQRRKTR